MAIPTAALKWMALVGGTFIMLTLGSVYTFGNMSPYITSYFHVRLNDSSIRYSTVAWVNSLVAIGQASSMPLSGFLEHAVGVRLTCLIGCVFHCLGMFLSSFSISSFPGFVATYGLMVGVGVGLTYPLCIACSIRWFPSRKGTIAGITMLGFGLSSTLFSVVQTKVINPDNLSPDLQDLSNAALERYFSQGSILDNVPRCFRLLAIIYGSMQLVGILLINSPAEHKEQDQERQSLVQPDQSAVPVENSASSSSIVNEQQPTERQSADVKLRQVLRSKNFYMLYFIFLCNFFTVNFNNSLYKAFGETFIEDDFFLTLTGSLSSVSIAAGRFIWGFVADHTSAKSTLFAICCLGSALHFSVYSCSQLPAIAYLVWVCLIFFTFSGVFSVSAAAIAKMYGTKYFSTIYGLLYTANIIAALVVPPLANVLLNDVGWFSMYCICAIFYVAGAVVAFFFEAKSLEGGIV